MEVFPHKSKLSASNRTRLTPTCQHDLAFPRYDFFIYSRGFWLVKLESNFISSNGKLIDLQTFSVVSIKEQNYCISISISINIDNKVKKRLKIYNLLLTPVAYRR